jgi:hypothetical protein
LSSISITSYESSTRGDCCYNTLHSFLAVAIPTLPIVGGMRERKGEKEREKGSEILRRMWR